MNKFFLQKPVTLTISRLGTLTSVAGLGLITGCKNETDEGVSPAEDLMREHGVLNRILNFLMWILLKIY